jgi:HNH endonuclease
MSEEPTKPVRAPISKKLRFEVFKRDSFTCQYCGQQAPNVILHVDHVRPVSDGGSADILNLITACTACNAGKGARSLSDQAVLSKQVDQLVELQERREQIEMMIQWRDELLRLSDETVQTVVEKIGERGGWQLNETGVANIRKWLKRIDAGSLLRAADEAFDCYLQYDKDGPTAESWNLAFSKIPAFVSIQQQEDEKPYLRRLLYIQGIIRRRFKHRHYDCIDYLEHLHLCGMTIEELERRAKRMRLGHIEDFEGPLDQWLTEIGRPF